MKTLFLGLLALTIAGSVTANGGPAATMKYNSQSCPSNMTCMNQGMQYGNGHYWGRGYGHGRWISFDQSNARGWQLMSVDERTAFQNEMRAVTTYEECSTVRDKHRALLEERASANNVTLMAPPNDICARMKANGIIK